MIRFLEATPFHSGTLGWEREAFTHTHTHTQKHKHRTLLHKSRCPCLQWWVTNTSVVYWSPQDLWWTVYQPNSISSHVELLGLEDWVCHFNPGPYISYFNFVEIAGYYDSPCDWIIQITFSAYCFITSDSWSLVVAQDKPLHIGKARWQFASLNIYVFPLKHLSLKSH